MPEHLFFGSAAAGGLVVLARCGGVSSPRSKVAHQAADTHATPRGAQRPIRIVSAGQQPPDARQIARLRSCCTSQLQLGGR
jgi:hypothetical protein